MKCSFPVSGPFPKSQLFVPCCQSIGASALVLPMNIQGWFSFALTASSLCSPWDSQESSPAPQSKSINSLALNLLYGPTLTSVHDSWKNRSFDYRHFCPVHWLHKYKLDLLLVRHCVSYGYCIYISLNFSFFKWKISHCLAIVSNLFWIYSFIL